MTEIRENRIPWMDDFAYSPSTNPPEITASEEMALGTLIIIIVSAVVSIIVLFGLALFIDWRHQKIVAMKRTPIRQKRRRMPKDEEVAAFADQMQVPISNPPSTSVIQT